MAEVVAAAAVVHAPQLLSRPPFEDIVKLDRSTDALRAFGGVLDDVEPDAIVLIGLDHLEAFWLESVPPFTVVLSPEVSARYMDRERRVPVHTDLAGHVLNECIRQDFDLTYSQEAVLGHAFLTPLEYVVADRQIPIVPLLVNTYLPPIPSPQRAFALGRAIGRALESRPERIAVIASGGMSHFPGTARYQSPNFEFDHWIIDQVERGEYDDLLSLTAVNLDEVGESELMTWFIALGLIGPRPGRLMSYQALSHHGHGVVQFLPALPAPDRATDEGRPPRFGGHVFVCDDYTYYRFPRPEELALNRMLHRIIADPEYRVAFVRDRAGVVAEAGLRPEESAALLSNQGFDVLRMLGAHPLLALSAGQVSEIEQRRQQEHAVANGRHDS